MEYNSCIYSFEQEWNNDMKSSLADTANEILQPKKNEIKKPWITDEILQLIDQRKKFNNRKDEVGKEIYKKLRWKVIIIMQKRKRKNDSIKM